MADLTARREAEVPLSEIRARALVAPAPLAPLAAHSAPSGRVVAEGQRWAVGDFLQALISRDTSGAVITVDEHFGPATGQYTDFSTH